MNAAFEIGAVALRAQQRALDAQANNVANINTPGFKRTDVQFAEVVASLPEPVTENERAAQELTSRNGGVQLSVRQALSDFGDLQPTTSALDLAIDGPGFIELLGPSGESILWRGGKLEINRDGFLSAAGLTPLSDQLAVPDDASAISISDDGIVRVEVSDGDPIELGQIRLLAPRSLADLEPMGSGQYRLIEGARVIDGIAGEDGFGILRQGMIEQSNVNMTQTMVDMMVLQSAYSASAQVIQTADQIASITNNLKR